MGGDFRQVGGDFLAKALDPEGPPPAQKTLLNYTSTVGGAGLSLSKGPSRKKKSGQKSDIV